MQRQNQLTAPQRVGESGVDLAVQLFVEGPQHTGAELREVDNEAAHNEHEANQELQYEQALQPRHHTHD